MSAISTQSQDFIGDIRTAASDVMDVADSGLTHKKEWDSQFGGASYLIEEHFTENNEGLTKTDIENGLDVLLALNIWLDVEGQNRRVYLQKLRT